MGIRTVDRKTGVCGSNSLVLTSSNPFSKLMMYFSVLNLSLSVKVVPAILSLISWHMCVVRNGGGTLLSHSSRISFSPSKV
ncbi:hypothetical protein ES705_38092 [subsurface metagenome]